MSTASRTSTPAYEATGVPPAAVFDVARALVLAMRQEQDRRLQTQAEGTALNRDSR